MTNPNTLDLPAARATIEVKFPAQRTVEYNGQTYVIVMTPANVTMKCQDGSWRPAYLYVSTADGSGYTREQQDMESKFTLSNRP